jgi:hypothetical protein
MKKKQREHSFIDEGIDCQNDEQNGVGNDEKVLAEINNKSGLSFNEEPLLNLYIESRNNLSLDCQPKNKNKDEK